MYKNLIFDLDGTLCECGTYYVEKQEKFADFQAERTGLPRALCLSLLKQIDVSFTVTPDGFTRHRFPRSFAATSATIDIMLGNPVDEKAAEQSFLIGDSVFSEPYHLFLGISSILKMYKDAGFNLFVLTKGDYEVQKRKLDINDLWEFFDPDKVYIVGQKTAESVQQIITDHSLVPNETIIIGDSIKDDIGSATGAGLHSVFISEGTGHWAYENEKHHPTYSIKKVIELPEIVDPRSLLVSV